MAKLMSKSELIQKIALPITPAVHPDRHQQRHVADLAGPTALEHDAVEINVGCSPSIGRLRQASIVP
jgi:predicted alpha/beta-hydrolase family hydrolase